jgi:hypothetical protein
MINTVSPMNKGIGINTEGRILNQQLALGIGNTMMPMMPIEY